MLSALHDLWPGFTLALAGMASPWLVCSALALTTLLVEDLAIAAGVAVAAQGLLAWELSFAAVALGIAAGDIALYGLGVAAARAAWLPRRLPRLRSALQPGALRQNLPTAVLLARVIPGLRLITYTACGFVRVPLLRFSAWVLLAVALWTGGLYWASAQIGSALSRVWGLPAPVAVALPIVVFAALVPLVRATRTRLIRRSVS
jgi:membrane protein DedA with SNARE-associated domain